MTPLNSAIEYVSCLTAGVVLTLGGYAYGSWLLRIVGLLLIAMPVIGTNVAEWLRHKQESNDEPR